ncbi:MAG: dUTP diphosphatase [Longimicrobiales bacterium]
MTEVVAGPLRDGTGGGASTPRPRVRFKRLPSNPDLPLPSRATPQAAGFDVRTCQDEVVLAPGEIRLVDTGLVMELPEGIECQVRPRSGLALKHGVTLPNSPGTIDPDYRGELRVIMQNLGSEPVRLARGERIAQLVFARFEAPDIEEADALSQTARGRGGFGSTGTD